MTARAFAIALLLAAGVCAIVGVILVTSLDDDEEDCSQVRPLVASTVKENDGVTGRQGVPGASVNDVYRCDGFLGLTKRQVASLYGYPQHKVERRADDWSIYAGEVNDYLGPGDSSYVSITFEAGRVVE